MDKKKNLGQFFTTNYEYILQGFKVPRDTKTVIEPFTGNGDLLKFSDLAQFCQQIECYDIEPRNSSVVQRDTLKNPPLYNNKFVITNPPYLARNKAACKDIYDKYNVNDLYKCFIKELLTNSPDGGIVIIPLNFWCSIRKNDIQLRKEFLSKFHVIRVNVFEERVFDDTSYTVCSFQFCLKKNNSNSAIKFVIFPDEKMFSVQLNEDNNYTIGGEIYKLHTTDKFQVTRLTSKNKTLANTCILVKCIDDNRDNKIGLKMVSEGDLYIDDTPNASARTYATLIIKPKITLEQQEQLVKEFNEFLNNCRQKYHSLFLANYRESKGIARKRISFDLVYLIVQHLLDQPIVY